MDRPAGLGGSSTGVASDEGTGESPSPVTAESRGLKRWEAFFGCVKAMERGKVDVVKVLPKGEVPATDRAC